MEPRQLIQRRAPSSLQATCTVQPNTPCETRGTSGSHAFGMPSGYGLTACFSLVLMSTITTDRMEWQLYSHSRFRMHFW